MFNIAIYQANTEISQQIKINKLLGYPEKKIDLGNLSDHDQIKIHTIIEKSISFILQY